MVVRNIYIYLFYFIHIPSLTGIATLIFYLELHDPDWLENMSNVYSMCTIKCYGGLQELHSAAKKVSNIILLLTYESFGH